MRGSGLQCERLQSFWAFVPGEGLGFRGMFLHLRRGILARPRVFAVIVPRLQILEPACPPSPDSLAFGCTVDHGTDIQYLGSAFGSK